MVIRFHIRIHIHSDPSVEAEALNEIVHSMVRDDAREREESTETEVGSDDVQRYDVMMMFASMSHTEHTFLPASW